MGIGPLIVGFQTGFYIIGEPSIPSAWFLETRQRIDIGEIVHIYLRERLSRSFLAFDAKVVYLTGLGVRLWLRPHGCQGVAWNRIPSEVGRPASQQKGTNSGGSFAFPIPVFADRRNAIPEALPASSMITIATIWRRSGG